MTWAIPRTKRECGLFLDPARRENGAPGVYIVVMLTMIFPGRETGAGPLVTRH